MGLREGYTAPERPLYSPANASLLVGAVVWAGFPLLLVAVHVFVQPRLRWLSFAIYPRGMTPDVIPTVAGVSGETNVLLWRSFTRLSHVFIHSPINGSVHLLFNLTLVGGASAVVYLLLRREGFARHFGWLYVLTVLLSAVVESYVFEWYATASPGFGASGVGFAFVGLAGVLGFTHVERRSRREQFPLAIYTFVGGCSTATFLSGNLGYVIVGSVAVGVVILGKSASFSQRESRLPVVVGNLILLMALAVLALDVVVRSNIHFVHFVGAGIGTLIGLGRHRLLRRSD